MKGEGRGARRRKQLLNDFKEKRRYWNLKAEALDCTLWKTHSGRGCGRRETDCVIMIIMMMTIFLPDLERKL